MAKQNTTVADYIEPLNMNGLQGRMLHLPAAKKSITREILVVYGHHSSIERWWGLVQNFRAYGTVTMPDLPGFGGMDSFYKIGQQPTIDAFADYLAAFVKMRYKRRRVTIAGISFGFVVATRMLQRYPDLVKKVDFIVSCAGFAHYDDFKFTKMRMFMYRFASYALARPVIVTLYKWIALNPWILRKLYARTFNAKTKFGAGGNTLESFEAMMDVEVDLWQVNEPKTYLKTLNEFLRIDNCKGPRVHLPVWHIYTKHDQYFHNHIVEQHFNIIFDECIQAPTNMKNHVVSVLADRKETAPFIPQKLRRYLSENQS